jgi:hypothetical protein
MVAMAEAPQVDDVLHRCGRDVQPRGPDPGVVGLIRRFYKNHRSTIGYVFLVVYVTVIGGVAVEQQRDFNEEALRARSANCLQFERDHLRDVDQLRQTYAYLEQLRPGEFEQPINRFIVARLSETETAARTDTAPDYCDEPGLGRPEPDPVVPERPAYLG